MGKLLFVDLLNKIDRDARKPLGHSCYLFRNYSRVLKRCFEVTIAASREYCDSLQDLDLKFLVLPFASSHPAKCKISRWRNLVKAMINSLYVSMYRYKVILIQDPNSLLPVVPIVLLTRRKKVFIIFYTDVINRGSALSRYFKKKLVRILAPRISGVISGSKMVVDAFKSFGIRAFLVPDYLPPDDYNGNFKSFSERKIDFTVLGTMTEGKDLEDVVKTFNATNYKVIIAGRFDDKNRYLRLKKSASSNIKMFDKYLDYDIYIRLLRNSKYIVLPYSKDTDKSSGVLYDALYAGTPVVYKGNVLRDIIVENKLGIVYNTSLKEVKIEQLINQDTYLEFLRNIESYVEKLSGFCKDLCNLFLEYLSK